MTARPILVEGAISSFLFKLWISVSADGNHESYFQNWFAYGKKYPKSLEESISKN
jgi:hypothetical protein